MRVMDEYVEELVVERDPAQSLVEVQITTAGDAYPRVIRLTSEEARRLAAIILLQASRLDRTRTRLGRPDGETERKSA